MNVPISYMRGEWVRDVRRIPEETENMIVELLKQGVTQKEIAKRCFVGMTTIKRTVDRFGLYRRKRVKD